MGLSHAPILLDAQPSSSRTGPLLRDIFLGLLIIYVYLQALQAIRTCNIWLLFILLITLTWFTGQSFRHNSLPMLTDMHTMLQGNFFCLQSTI